MIEGINVNNILLFFVQGAHFLLLVLLSIKLLHQYRVRIKLLLGTLLAFWVVLHIKDLIIYQNVTSISIQQIHWITIVDVLTVPLCAIIQFEIIKSQCINYFRAFIIALPFVALLAIYSILPSHTIIVLSFILSAIYSFFMIIYTFVICSKLPHYNPNRRAAIFIINAFIVIFLSWIFSCIISRPISDIIYYIASGLAWGVIFYTIENIYSVEQEEQYKQEVTSINIHEYTFAGSLNQLMQQEQIYLNPEISISEVAKLIGTNRSYLSDYLNHNCNSSFIDYINNLRLEHAEKLMKDDHTTSIDSISISSGFNSLSTFRRAFIKKHGITPSAYRQKLKESDS